MPPLSEIAAILAYLVGALLLVAAAAVPVVAGFVGAGWAVKRMVRDGGSAG